MKRRTLWINLGVIAAIVVVLGLIFAAMRPSAEPVAARTVVVSEGDVSATVTASGTVQRTGVVDLVFSTGGTVTSVDVEPGDAVVAGQVLATVDDTTALQQLASAESTLAQAVQGSASSAASVASASSALSDARRVAKQTNKRNELAVDQAKESLRVAQNLWDESCVDPNSVSCPNPSAQAQLRSVVASAASAQRALDTATQNAANNAIGYEIAINQASATLDQRRVQQSASCGDDSTTAGCQSAVASTLAAQQALENAQRARTTGLLADEQAQESAALSLASANVTVQKTQADLRKAGQDAVRSARQALDTAERTYRQGKVAGEQSIRAAQSALRSATAVQETFEALDGEELTANEAAISAAQSSVAVAQQAVEETSLRTPVSGIVGQVPYVVGEVASVAGTAGGITVLPDGPLEVVAAFAESDAASITVGASATVSFDALAGQEAAGTVVAVDPVATTSGTGLITYSVRVQVADPPAEVREGMTATVSVLVDEVSGVLVVPQSAITGTGAQTAVLVQQPDGTSIPTPVTVGLQGDTGTEVTGGISAGDVLVIPSAEDLSFPEGGVPGSGRDPDPDGPFGGGGDQ